MSSLTTRGFRPTHLHYTDTEGPGRPIVLIHGWPASETSWDRVTPALADAGYRVIAYDRRGFGRSGEPHEGYDYDFFAADLDDLLTELDVVDAVLVGFSMGGGEVARYLAKYGTGRVTAAVFVASITPALDSSLADNPDGGLSQEAAAGMQAAFHENPEGFLTEFLMNFYSVTVDGAGRLMTPREQVIVSLEVANQASREALEISIGLWLTDFRADLASVSVPTLVIHGDGDQIVPFEVSGKRMPQYVPQAKVTVIAEGPHGLLASHPDQVAAAILEFLG